MRKVKYRCDNCGYGHSYTKKEELSLAIKQFFISILLVIGMFTIIFFVVVGPIRTFDLVGGAVVSSFSSHGDYHELRRLAINYTESCRDRDYNTNSFCNGIQVYQHLNHLEYIPSSHYYPMNKLNETLQDGGDCKNLSVLYVEMMKSLGFDAEVVCSLKEQHCIAVLPYVINLKYQEQFAVVDLTIPEFYVMQEEENAWDYLEKGKSLSSIIIGGN
jgi:hypothetical protein